MKGNEYLINESLTGKLNVLVSVRSIACDEKQFSQYKEYTEESKRFIFNSNLIDGVKFKLRYTIIFFNARHNLF